MNPLKLDPTRTTTLRRRFDGAIAARFRLFKKDLYDLLVLQDAFGLKRRPLALNEASTQLNLKTKKVLDRVTTWQKALDPKDVIKLDDLPHVTVRYGFQDEDQDNVKALLNQHSKVLVKLGKLSLFKSSKSEVLKVEVESEQLRQIHRHLGIVNSPQDYKDYNPHMTVAYLKPGTGDKYLYMSGLEGTRILVDKVTWSSSDREHSNVVLNEDWRFHNDDRKLVELKKWLKFKTGQLFLKQEQDDSAQSWLGQYIKQAYAKGLKRSNDDWKKPTGPIGFSPEAGRAYQQGQVAEFMRQAFGGPTPQEKVRQLATRTFNDLQGVTDSMSTTITRMLMDASVSGINPREVGAELNKVVSGYRRRGTAIARTEIIRGFNEGALDGLENLGAKSVGVMVEWVVSGLGVTKLGNPSPCHKCAPLANLVLTIEEARGLLPRHPNCMCSFIPANVGEKTDKQVRDAKRIRAAIKRSAQGDTRWMGSKKKIARKRPILTGAS